MKETEARRQLTVLRCQECVCGCERVRVFFHESKCPYRMAAWLCEQLKPYIGLLYTEELPEAA